MRPQILAHVPELDVGIQAAPEVDKIVAVLDCPARVRDENTDPRVGLRQDEALYDLQEFRVIVDPGLKIMCKDRNLSFGLACDFDGGLTHLFACRNDPAPAFFA